MNWLILWCVMACACLAAAETYTDRYDNINLDDILGNRKLLISYINCLLEQGKCTPEGKELQVHMKDAIQTACNKCTEKQRTGARKVLKHFRSKEPEYWVQLKANYDPEDKYKDTYESFLARDD